MAIAARLSKYGLSLDDILWRLPLCVVNQFIIYDELANGRKPRWRTGAVSEESIDELLSEAMTPFV